MFYKSASSYLHLSSWRFTIEEKLSFRKYRNWCKSLVSKFDFNKVYLMITWCKKFDIDVFIVIFSCCHRDWKHPTMECSPYVLPCASVCHRRHPVKPMAWCLCLRNRQVRKLTFHKKYYVLYFCPHYLPPLFLSLSLSQESQGKIILYLVVYYILIRILKSCINWISLKFWSASNYILPYFSPSPQEIWERVHRLGSQVLSRQLQPSSPTSSPGGVPQWTRDHRGRGPHPWGGGSPQGRPAGGHGSRRGDGGWGRGGWRRRLGMSRASWDWFCGRVLGGGRGS